MTYGLERMIRRLTTPATLTETPNRLPGSPEMIAAEIAEVERDIQCWKLSPLDYESQCDIAYAEGRLQVLRLQLAEADRRKQNLPVPFPERRMVDWVVKDERD